MTTPKTNWPEQGVHHGVPFKDYRACDMSATDNINTCAGKSVSKSLIVDFIKDPAAWRIKPRKTPTAAMLAGSLFDCLLTTPDEFDVSYTISKYAEFRSNEAKQWRANMEASGVQVVTEDQLETAQRQLKAVQNKPEAVELLDGCAFQVAFRHKTKHPFWSKGLIDVLPLDTDTIVDIKTCDNRALESHRAMMMHIMDWGYHIQAGAYCEGFSHASGQERHKFKFIFVGKAAPFTTAVVELPLSAILYGAEVYRNGVRQLAQCLETNRWPSIWDGTVEIDLPEYAYNQKD